MCRDIDHMAKVRPGHVQRCPDGDVAVPSIFSPDIHHCHFNLLPIPDSNHTFLVFFSVRFLVSIRQYLTSARFPVQNEVIKNAEDERRQKAEEEREAAKKQAKIDERKNRKLASKTKEGEDSGPSAVSNFFQQCK